MKYVVTVRLLNCSDRSFEKYLNSILSRGKKSGEVEKPPYYAKINKKKGKSSGKRKLEDSGIDLTEDYSNDVEGGEW